MLNAVLPGTTGFDADTLLSLMRRYQASDLLAAEELVAKLSPTLLRFLSGPQYTRDQNEDLLQECWLQIHAARHTFRSDFPLLPWIFAIARNVRCRTYHCRRRIRAREFSVEPLPEGDGIAPQELYSWDCGFLNMIEVLPESQREVLYLQNVLGMSIAEIALKTSSSAGSVKQKTHRAYQKLRSIYAIPLLQV